MRARLFDTSERRVGSIAPQVIRNLTAFTQGVDLEVGARVTSTADAATCMKFLEANSQGILIAPYEGPGPGRRRPRQPDQVRTVRAIDSDLGVYETRRQLERAHRQGEGTCLIVNSVTPVPNILRQLHLSHEYVLVDWRPELTDRFTLGLIKTAWENASTVIADQVRDVDQAREAVIEGVTLGILQRGSNRRSADPVSAV